jgi:putative ABC transport system permease protein
MQQTGLDEPNEAILSSRWATKYFGKEDAIGEVLKYEGQEYRVTAIMEDFALPTRIYHLNCWFLTYN